MKMKLILALALLLLALHTVSAQKQKKAAPKPEPVAGSNFEWRKNSIGQVFLSFSIKNTTYEELTSVKYRIIFRDGGGEPVDYVDGEVTQIPARLAIHQERMIANATHDIWSRGGGASFHLTVTSVEPQEAIQRWYESQANERTKQ